jgi:hypothetical protein
MFDLNVQHDCHLAKCTDTGQCKKMQERVESGVMESFIEHKPLDRYIVNLHSLHNPHHLRKALPRHLTKPVPLWKDEIARKIKHYEFAAKLRADQTTKQDKKAAKATEKNMMKDAPNTASGSGRGVKRRRQD